MMKTFASMLAIVALVQVLSSPVLAGPNPADKIAVSGNATVILQTPLTSGSSSVPVTLMSGTIKTSSPTDLILQVSAECGLYTDVTVTGDNSSTAAASVDVWVEIDGPLGVVPVSSFPSPDDGKVTFTNRSFTLSMMGFQDGEIIRIYEDTKAAHEFNWVALNLGPGTHTVEVKGVLTANVTGVGNAKALIAKRTLIGIPAKLANNAEI